MATSNLTAQRLQELLDYDPATGIFRNKVSRKGSTAGTISGWTLTGTGYRSIRIETANYLSHRLAWLYVHGCWPKGQIDHINGDRADNRIANLRDVSSQANHQNQRRPHADSRSGVLGITWCNDRKAWRAQITVDGRTRQLGSSKDKQQAQSLYIEAKRRLHEGCTI